MPLFKIKTTKKQQLGDHEIPSEGTLEIAGTQFTDKDIPHPMECIHLLGNGSAPLEKILLNFLSRREDLITRIHAVEFCRFFTDNLNDKFAVLMPTLEAYLNKKYTTPEEESYLNDKQKFFDYIDASLDDQIRNFSLKHLSVKNSKAPSLKTLLSRAISYLNTEGFAFPANYADRIHKRRGVVFHSVPDMSSDDVMMFSFEIQAAMGLLMLHTMEDLGVDLKQLANEHFALADLRMFMVRQDVTPRSPESPVLTPAEAVRR